MKYEDVEKFATDEVRAAVAKAQGWRVANVMAGDREATVLYNKDRYVTFRWGYDNLISEFSDVSYQDSRDYMALYDEILKADPYVGIYANGIIWNINDTKYTLDGERWEAIARAWLVICGDE